MPAGGSATCRYCGQVVSSDRPAPSQAQPSQQIIYIVGPDDDDAPSVPSIPTPPPANTAVARVIMITAICVVAGVVVSIVTTMSAASRSHPRRDSQHQRR